MSVVCPSDFQRALQHQLRTEPEVGALFDRLTAGRTAPAPTPRIDAAIPARACDAADWASQWRTWRMQHAISTEIV